MKTDEPKSNYLSKHVVSIFLAIAVMLASPMVLMVFTFFFDYTGFTDISKMVVISIFTLTLIALPCYFICRHNFRSVWYIPLIVNLGTILILKGILSNYWDSNAKVILLFVAVLLAVVMSILGSRKGQQAHTK